MDLSVVIPCYNEARRLPETVRHIQRHLADINGSREFILIDDGSRDNTLTCMQEMAGCNRDVRVVALPTNRGKGRAVAEGVRVSRGNFVLVTDADLATPIDELPKLQRAVKAGADIASGSRAAPGAREINQPVHRRLMGKAFNLLVRAAVLPGFTDTQCGFKLFQGRVARELFNQLRIDGFAFDVEVLWRAKLAGYRVEEVPVRWRNSDASRVSPVRHSLQMSRDLLWLWLRQSSLAPTHHLATEPGESQ